VSAIHVVSVIALGALPRVVAEVAVGVNASAGSAGSASGSIVLLSTGGAGSASGSEVRTACCAVRNGRAASSAGCSSVRVESGNAGCAVHAIGTSSLQTVHAVCHHARTQDTGRTISCVIGRNASSANSLPHSSFLAILTVGNGSVAERASMIVGNIVLVSAVSAPSASTAVFLTGDAIGHTRRADSTSLNGS
jgi:hypothetical protein